MILWTSSSYWFVWGSRWDIVDAFQVISHRSLGIDFSSPNDGKTLSLKWQSTKRAIKTSPVKGLRYLWNQGLVNLDFDDNKTRFGTNDYILSVIRQKDFQSCNQKHKIKTKRNQSEEKDLKEKCFSKLKLYRISW